MRNRTLNACLLLASVTCSGSVTAVCNSNLSRENPDSDFAINADGHTVTHTRTGLTWRRCQLGMEWNGSTCTGIPQALIWQNALLAVQSINTGAGLDGHHDWRLPDLNEIMTLVDHACYEPATNATVFPHTAYPSAHLAKYWSSTPDGSVGRAWIVDFQFGMLVAETMANSSLRVRPVRGVMTGSPGGQPPLTAFVDNFDSFEQTVANGWLTGNMSAPLGTSAWLWGSNVVFPAQSGAPNSQLVVNFNSTTGSGTISNWLLTPLLQFRPGSTVSFWTRTAPGAAFADRLQVRLCVGQPCNTVGPGATGVGGFSTLLRDINPNLQTGTDPAGIHGYPDQWARFDLGPANGVPDNGIGRIAFRYFVPNGGPDGLHSNIIGLDTVRIEATPVMD